MKDIIENSISSTIYNENRMCDEETLQLTRLISNLTPHDGTFNQKIPGLYINRYSKVEMNVMKTFYLPSLMIVVQGAKSVILGKEIYMIKKAQMLMFPVALQVSLKTTQASLSEPFLSIGLELDPQKISELALKVYPNGLPAVHRRSVGYVINTDVDIINAVCRLVNCIQRPIDSELIAPLVMDEILIRILRSNIGVQVAEIGYTDSYIQQVKNAITWLRSNFSQQIKVSDLAHLVNMSESSFYEHFKSVTAMSPLQYQKALRLHEARRLMVTESMDATTACQMVGYVSYSQFSRDYRRFLGIHQDEIF